MYLFLLKIITVFAFTIFFKMGMHLKVLFSQTAHVNQSGMEYPNFRGKTGVTMDETECTFFTNEAQTMICTIPLINCHCPGLGLTI